MEIKTVTLGEIKTDPNNARKHSDKNLAAISASLKKFGQRKPIVVHNGVILAGNGTYEAAKSLGWKEIVIVETPKEWDRETATAYALADNRTAELAEWDEAILAVQLVDLTDMNWDLLDLGFEKQNNEIPNFQPEEVEQPKLDQRDSKICPACAFEWRVGVRGEIEPV